MPTLIAKNYRALKTASKVSCAKSGTEEAPIYTVTKKQFDGETGEAKSDQLANVLLDNMDAEITMFTEQVTSLESDIADLQALKTDLEAL